MSLAVPVHQHFPVAKEPRSPMFFFLPFLTISSLSPVFSLPFLTDPLFSTLCLFYFHSSVLYFSGLSFELLTNLLLTMETCSLELRTSSGSPSAAPCPKSLPRHP